MAYALTMMGIYPVGIPAVFAWLLFENIRGLVNADRETLVQLEPLRDLWAAYNPSQYYYEVVECGRRIVCICMASLRSLLSAARLSYRVHGSSLCVCLFVYFGASVSLYKADGRGYLPLGGGRVIVASIHVPFLMKVDVTQDTTYAFLTFLVFSSRRTYYLLLVTVLLQIVVFVKALRKAKGLAMIIDEPVRRTFPAPLRSVCSMNEGRGGGHRLGS